MADKLDIIKGLHDRAWQSFDERRRHEYYFDYVVWAGYALFIAGALGFGKEGGPLAKATLGFLILLSVILLVLAVVHIRWLIGVARAQRLDMVIADFYASKLRGEIEIASEFTEATGNAKPMLVRYDDSTVFTQKWWRLLKNYNHQAEALVTVLLAAAAIGVIVFYAPR